MTERESQERVTDLLADNDVLQYRLDKALEEARGLNKALLAKIAEVTELRAVVTELRETVVLLMASQGLVNDLMEVA